MAEDQELKITITAVDNASAVIKSLQDQIAQLSGGAAKNNLDQLRRSTKESSDQFKAFGEDIKKASEQILPPFVRGIGGVATAFVGLAFAAERGLTALKGFAQEVRNISTAAAQGGIATGQFKDMVDQFRVLAGVDAGTAQRNISGLLEKFGDLQRLGSNFRQELAKKAGLGGQEDMERWLIGTRFVDFSDFVNQVKEKSDEVYNNMFEHQRAMGASMDAAATTAGNARRRFLDAMGGPELIAVYEKFHSTSEQMIKLWRDYEETSRTFMVPTEKIAIAWERIKTSWDVSLMKALQPEVEKIAQYFDRIADDAEKSEGYFEGINKFVLGAVQGFQDIATAATTIHRELQPVADFLTWLNENGQKLSETWKGFVGATDVRPNAGGPSKEELLDQPPTSWSDWWRSKTGRPPAGATQPQRFMGGGYDDTGWGNFPLSSNIEDRRGEADLPKATRDLVNEMKRLNDWLQVGGITGTVGGARVSGGFGLGGSAGIGGGVSSAYRSGPLSRYAGAGEGPQGLWFPQGGGAGGGATAAGAGGTQGGGGGAAAGYGGAAGSGSQDPSVPGDILATAEHAALSGGPGAVEKFMADAGYPRSGNWCGEFAASVVKKAGGTPPKNPQVASNWRNWGLPDTSPHPGDIAVAGRGVPTGATGSHVTVVKSYDPKTGTFVGVGGNQRSGPEATFKASGYSFRRSVGGKGGLPNGSDVGAGTGEGAGETPASGSLAEARAKLAADPAGINRLLGLTEGEVGSQGPQAKQAFMETVLNRAAARGQTLSQAATDKGYYPGSSQHAAARGASAAQRADLDPILGKVLGGSNISGFATGNASGAVHFAGGPETYSAGGERFGIEGPDRSWAHRMALERATHRVEGSGTIDVNVNAPRGTRVGARSSGFFNKTKINRQVQMERAASSVPAEE